MTPKSMSAGDLDLHGAIDAEAQLRLTSGLLPPLALRFAPVPRDGAEARFALSRFSLSLSTNLNAAFLIFSSCV